MVDSFFSTNVEWDGNAGTAIRSAS